MKWWNKRKELTIIGYYESNFGDLLMLQGIIEHLPEHIRNINILSTEIFHFTIYLFKKTVSVLKFIIVFNGGNNL